MNKKSLFFLFVLFSFSAMVYKLPSAWFIYFPKEYIVFPFFICSILQIIISFYLKRKEKYTFDFSNRDSILFPVMLMASLSLMIFFPIRNLNLGDGVLLLEHVALETKNFGYHLTMDEILEALIHSVLYAKLNSIFATPMEVYRLVSTVCGFIAIGILFTYFRKMKITTAGYYLVLTSGGIYLFHGYNENYTIITTVLWFYILFVMDSIRHGEKRNLKALLPICLIACTLILLHLVSGYLLFSLIYLCYHFSDKGKFIRNALYCTFISLCILAPVFTYFTFFSEVRFDFSQTHLTNPKFYPLSKIISITHFRDILFCIIGSSFLPFIMMLYLSIFYKKEVKTVLQRNELIFLLFVLLGFSIHGFVHYPQLGFPADWDLLAFYWTPIAFLSAILITEKKIFDVPISDSKPLNKIEVLPIFLFAGIIFIMNVGYLSKPDEKKIKDFEISMERINRYSNFEISEFLNKIKPEYKKFFLQVSFFLFESKEKIENNKMSDNEISKKLLEENRLFKEELENNIWDVKSKWQKDFYSRMTKYHIEYLKLLEKK